MTEALLLVPCSSVVSWAVGRTKVATDISGAVLMLPGPWEGGAPPRGPEAYVKSGIGSEKA
jgi:hypothetical protein